MQIDKIEKPNGLCVSVAFFFFFLVSLMPSLSASLFRSLPPSLSTPLSLCSLSSQIILKQVLSPQVATLFSDLSNMILTFICIFMYFCVVFFFLIRLSRVQALPWLFIMRTWCEGRFENEVETKWITPGCERIEFNNTAQHNSKTFFVATLLGKPVCICQGFMGTGVAVIVTPAYEWLWLRHKLTAWKPHRSCWSLCFCQILPSEWSFLDLPRNTNLRDENFRDKHSWPFLRVTV